MMTGLAQNVRDLEADLDWFARVMNARFQSYFGDETAAAPVDQIAPPDVSTGESPYARFITQQAFSFAERLALVLALVPHLRPQLLDIFFTRNATFDRRFSEFGGDYNTTAAGFIPTGETLAFLLGETDLAARFEVYALLNPDHRFGQQQLLHVNTPANEPRLTGRLEVAPPILSQIILGQPYRPDHSADFPAQRVATTLTWADLVLHPGTQRQIDEIEAWLHHGDTLLYDWAMADRLRPGYRSLFYGPPGTGKTMTACLLGQSTGRDVYKIDLSLVVSKYIGETEKNLNKVFDQAQHRGWILFFDEADALFGKRSETKDAHDRYANQEIAFLLQRIETFDGIVILASNRRDDLDAAFARRFESVVYFPVPRPEERLRLWQQGFSARSTLDADVDLKAIATEHALTGGAIMNVIRYASLETLRQGHTIIRLDAIRQGIRREYAKEGKGI